jgi:molybdopterin molybdotransferase
VTGDELEAVGAPVDDYQIRDSNGPALHALFDRPWIAARRAPRVLDDVTALRDAVADALATSDAVVLTGGVSKGAYDHVPGVLAGLGVDVLFHRLPQRPGHPVLGGVTATGVPVFGLPGNPLSAMVTGRRLVLPTLAARAGMSVTAAGIAPRLVTSPDQRSLPNHWHFPLVTLRDPSPGADVALVSSRGSGDLVALGRSDGFIEIPPGHDGPGPWPFYPW